jgi:hypothetical protein
MHTYRPGNLRDEIPKRRRLWPTPSCKAMEEEEAYKSLVMCTNAADMRIIYISRM